MPRAQRPKTLSSNRGGPLVINSGSKIPARRGTEISTSRSRSGASSSLFHWGCYAPPSGRTVLLVAQMLCAKRPLDQRSPELLERSHFAAQILAFGVLRQKLI